MIRVELSGPLSGEENMRRDVESAMECLSGRTDPALRLYSWNPPAISLGAHQDPSIVNSRIANIHGVDIVTRPTGGGAILHTDEITYCVTVRLHGRKPSNVYSTITDALLCGLGYLDVSADAETWPSQSPPSGRYRAEPLCFSGIARNEIRVGGRKLIGSAQRIFRSQAGERVILQHGSILMSDAHALLPVYMRQNLPGTIEENVLRLKAHSTSLSELMGRRPGRSEVVTAMRKGFERTSDLWEAPAEVRYEHRQEAPA